MVQPSDLASRWKPLQPRMINLTYRSLQKELLDADDIPFADIRQNMKELNSVNTWLGGHNISIAAIKELLSKTKEDGLIICDIGCGGGDNLSAIAGWCDQNNIKAEFIGIDIKKECISFAEEQYPELPATWIVRNFRKVEFERKPAVIFSSLFCHHFPEDEIVSMLGWMHDNCTVGFFINDLHRNRWAYHLIRGITGIFSRSYLVKHDAPLSVARGFKKTEWISLLQCARLEKFTITWKWAFRYLVICYK